MGHSFTADHPVVPAVEGLIGRGSNHTLITYDPVFQPVILISDKIKYIQHVFCF